MTFIPDGPRFTASCKAVLPLLELKKKITDIISVILNEEQPIYHIKQFIVIREDL